MLEFFSTLLSGSLLHLNYPAWYTHTHPFNGPLAGTTRVSRYQKGKISLDFTEARDSEWQWHQLGSAPHSRQTTTPAPHHSVFLHAGWPSCQPNNSVKALKAIITRLDSIKNISWTISVHLALETLYSWRERRTWTQLLLRRSTWSAAALTLEWCHRCRRDDLDWLQRILADPGHCKIPTHHSRYEDCSLFRPEQQRPDFLKFRR